MDEWYSVVLPTAHCFTASPALLRPLLRPLQALDEAEDDWSQHAAKRIINTKGKGLRESIPPNFPYFHVEFGLQVRGNPRV